MRKRKLVSIVSIFAIVAITVSTLPLAKVNAQTGHKNHGHMGKMKTAKPAKVKTQVLEKLHSGHFPMLSKSIDKALNALEKGDKRTAVTELKKAKMMMGIISKMISDHNKAGFVNVKCPIMDSPINPEKVTKDLTCEYKGQKVAFCCAGCPASWDKLSDSQKEAKLTETKPVSETIWTCPMHPEIKQPKPGLCPKCNMKLKPVKK